MICEIEVVAAPRAE